MQSNGNGTEVWEKGIQVDLPDGEYEIEYTILLDSASIANAGKKPMEVIAVVYVAAVIAVSITAWQIHRKRKGKKE